MKHTLISIILIALTIPCSAQWKNASMGGQVLAFGVHDTSLFLSLPVDENFPMAPTLYRLVSLTPNVIWRIADTGIDPTQGAINLFASLGKYFFGAPYGHRIYETTSEGSQWSLVNAASPMCSNGRYLFATLLSAFGNHPRYICRSSDSGATWDSISAISPINLWSNGPVVFVTDSGGGWRSMDNGQTWTQFQTPFTASSLIPMDSLLFIVANGQVAESSDSGSQWTTVAVDSASTTETVNCLATDGKNLFAGTQRGVLVSTDGGAHWAAKNDSLYNLWGAISPAVTQMTVFDTSVFIEVTYGTGKYYVFDRPISELTKPDSTASVVQSIQPEDTIEIYPNPATGIVTIHAGGSSIIGVSVLNVLGSDVLDVTNSYSSQLSIDLSQYPAGTYFLQVQTDQGTILKKVTLDK